MIIPEYINLSGWAASLIIDFPKDNIPILTDENDWKNWGNFLVQENSFIENNAPGPDTFNDWKSWAEAVFFTMANNP